MLELLIVNVFDMQLGALFHWIAFNFLLFYLDVVFQSLKKNKEKETDR
jgi:hypothetical protein